MNHKRKRILALVLTAAVIIALPVIGASAADLIFDDGKVANTTSLSFTVGPTTDTAYFDDLKTADVKVDLYKIAAAVAETIPEGQSGHGSMYVFSLAELDTYDELAAMDNDSWRTLAKTKANAILGTTVPTANYSFTASDGVTEQKTVAAGLYLVVAHGKDMAPADYIVKDASGDVTTVADSATYRYTYYPELIALPTTVATMGVASGTTVNYNTYTGADGKQHTGVSTAGGTWQASLSAMLKPTREFRFGNLRIIKDAPAPSETGYATFVFYIEAKDADKKVVYKDYCGLSLPGYKQKDIIGKIPVGSTVTVTEVYTGANYTLSGMSWRLNNTATTDHTIRPQKDADGKDQILIVTVTNNPGNTIIRGYGIENEYTYQDDTWTWVKHEARGAATK